jgi:hypothetical protein
VIRKAIEQSSGIPVSVLCPVSGREIPRAAYGAYALSEHPDMGVPFRHPAVAERYLDLGTLWDIASRGVKAIDAPAKLSSPEATGN